MAACRSKSRIALLTAPNGFPIDADHGRACADIARVLERMMDLVFTVLEVDHAAADLSSRVLVSFRGQADFQTTEILALLLRHKLRSLFAPGAPSADARP